MSKVEQTSTLGYTIKVAGTPSTAQEYDEDAGQTGACRDRAVDSDLQHDWKGRFRAAFCEAVEKETGIERHYELNDKGKKVYTEKEKPYIIRVKAMGNDLTALAQQVADAEPYKTQSMGGAIGKKWLEDANDIITVVENSGKGYEKFIQTITSLNPGFTFVFEDDEETPTRDSIALALKVDDARINAEAAAKRAGYAV